MPILKRSYHDIVQRHTITTHAMMLFKPQLHIAVLCHGPTPGHYTPTAHHPFFQRFCRSFWTMLGLNTAFDAELPAAATDIVASTSRTCLIVLEGSVAEDLQDTIDSPFDGVVSSSDLGSILNPLNTPSSGNPSHWGTSEVFPGSSTGILGPKFSGANFVEPLSPSGRSSMHQRPRMASARRTGELDGDCSQTSQSPAPTVGKHTIDLSRVSTQVRERPRVSTATSAWPESTQTRSLDCNETPILGPEVESTLKRASEAIHVRELHHWCATVAVLLLLHGVSDCINHRFRYLPSPSEWCVLLLLLSALGCSAGLACAPRMRPYAGHLLAVGSLLMTCLLTWYWHGHVAQIKDSIHLGPSLNGTAAAHGSSSVSPPYASPCRFVFGSSGLDLLEAATAFVVLFENCVQASFLCRLGVRMAATVGVLQWIIFACWPFMAADTQSTWACRIVAAGIWTAHLTRSSYVWESELRQQSQRIDDLRQAVAESRRDLQDRQDADSVLNHILKNTMADACGCIDLFHQKNIPDDYLCRASDLLFRGMWWCKLREALLQMIAGRYKMVRETVDVKEFAQDFVRGREVALECLPQMVQLDPMACNVVLDNAVTNAMRHGCQKDPQVQLSVEMTEQGSQDIPEETQAGVPTHL